MLVVKGDRIDTVGAKASVSIPAGAEVIDLRSSWVLPGLIDCHTHMSNRADKYSTSKRSTRRPSRRALAAVVNAKKTLDAGFTSIRDVGSPPFLAVDLRNSINEGFIPGPRIVASGPPISITGGHGDFNGYSPEVNVTMYPKENDYAIADGPEAVRHLVRAQVKYGVDVIKILATGGVLSKGDSPGAEQMTYEEMKMAVDEAHRTGRKVAAHAHGTLGIKDAVRAGVDSIEHGSLIDAEGIAMMKEHGTYLVADIYDDEYILGKASEFGMSKESIEKEKTVGPAAAGELSEGGGSGREDCVRNGCRRLSARRQRETIRLHGEIWHDSGGGDSRGHFKCGRAYRPRQGCGHAGSGQVCGHDRGTGESAGQRDRAGKRELRDEGRDGLPRRQLRLKRTKQINSTEVLVLKQRTSVRTWKSAPAIPLPRRFLD